MYGNFNILVLCISVEQYQHKESHIQYDYGGVTNLYKGMLNGKKITDFNFEQQAEIMEDYYVLLSSHQPYNGFYEDGVQVLLWAAIYLMICPMQNYWERHP